jgi:predicted Zn-dependent protease
MAHSDTTGPNYYRRGTIQVWTFIRDQGLNFHLGNAIKYICRAGYKDSRAEDLKKAIHYLQNELENTVIQAATSKGIQEKFPGEEQYYASFTDYAEAFDR